MKKIKIFSIIDYVLLFCVLCLTAIGIAFIYSAAINQDGVLTNQNYIRQIFWGFTGLVLMFVIASYDYRNVERYIFWLAIFACLILLYTAKFGKTVKGSKSWLGIGSFGIQPSEFCKIIFILFLGWYLNNTENENPKKRFFVSLFILIIPIGLIMLQPDLGTSLVFFPIYLFMCFIAGIKFRYIFLILGIGFLSILFTMLPVWEAKIVGRTVAALNFLTNPRIRLIITVALAAITLIGILGTFFFKHNRYYYWISYFSGILFVSLLAATIIGKFLKEYQLSRLIIFLDPQVDAKNSGWNIIQSKIAIGAGGFFGRGFLKGTQSHLNYLPEQGTDFIFSILCEEWGFLGGILVFTLYLIIMLRMLYIIKNTSNKYGIYITTGIFAMFFFHFMENIGMVMGLMPITGIPLLFMSYGGSSIWASMICIGLVMAVRYRKYNFMD